MSETILLDQPSSYMDFLPTIYRQGEVDGKANFLGRFLKIFEKLLSGIDDDSKVQEREVVGIEQILDKIHDYFDPLFTPPIFEKQQTISEFIAYLSYWVALIQNQTWDVKSQRRLLHKIVPLYKKRGTEAGLSEYLRIYLQEFIGAEVTIQELLEGIQVGVSANVGQNSVVGGTPPYFFFVKIALGTLQGFRMLNNLVINTRAIVDLEKPAHTYYAVLYKLPNMIVGERSSVAEDTLIGSQFGLFA